MTNHHPRGPSSLNALALCPCWKASEGEPGEAARRGSFVHEAIAYIVAGRPDECQLTAGGRDSAAVEWGAAVVAEEIAGRPYECEARLSLSDGDFGKELSFGTADFIVGNTVIDIKTGSVRDCEWQLRAYALMFMERDETANCRTLAVYADERRVIEVAFDRDESWRHLRALWAQLDDPNRKPNPCEYCQWCGDQLSCPAITRVAGEIVVAREPTWGTTAGTWTTEHLKTPEDRGKGMLFAKILRGIADSLEFHIRTAAIAGAEVAGYECREEKGRRSIDKILGVREALPELPEGAIDGCCSISVGDLERAWEGVCTVTPSLRSKLADGRGWKKAAKRLLEERIGKFIKVGAPVYKMVKTVAGAKKVKVEVIENESDAGI